jgi:hypothetical protein
LRKNNLSDDDENDDCDVNGDNDRDTDDDEECDDDGDGAPTVLAHVELVQTVRECINLVTSHDIYLDTEQRLTPADFAAKIELPIFPELIQRFLYDQLYPESHLTSSDVSLDACPVFLGVISLFSSATASFYAPSDPSGIRGICREQIRATDSWRGGPARYDCAFVNTHPELAGLRGLDVVRVLAFLSFTYHNKLYGCALVRWYSVIGEDYDEDTGMWMLTPDLDNVSIIHVDTILRAGHLLPIFGHAYLPRGITYHNSLDTFATYYVNKFIDHHAFDITV